MAEFLQIPLALGPYASTGEHYICIVSDLLWLGLVWSCFVFCLLFLLFYVICAPVLTEGTLALIARVAKNISALREKSSYKNVDTLPSVAFYLY